MDLAKLYHNKKGEVKMDDLKEKVVIITGGSSGYGKITASAVLAVIFPVLFVLILQHYIVKGLTAGTVKE